MNQTAVIWTVIISALIVLGGVFLMTNSVSNTIDDIDIPSAEDLVGLIDIPEAPVSAEDGRVDRLCELENGCEFWEPKSYHIGGILNALDENEAADDFVDALANLLDLDDKQFELDGAVAKYANKHNVINAVRVADFNDDIQIRAYTTDYPEYHEDDDWEIKILLRVTYQDIDEADKDHIYVVLTSTLDEGEYDKLSLEEVSRNFKFE